MAAAGLVAGLVLFGLALLQESNRRGLAAEQRAREVQAREQARKEVREFRRLADELHFHAAGTEAPGEQAPYYDQHRGEKAGQAALALVRGWGSKLEDLPLAEASARSGMSVGALKVATHRAVKALRKRLGAED